MQYLHCFWKILHKICYIFEIPSTQKSLFWFCLLFFFGSILAMLKKFVCEHLITMKTTRKVCFRIQTAL